MMWIIYWISHRPTIQAVVLSLVAWGLVLAPLLYLVMQLRG